MAGDLVLSRSRGRRSGGRTLDGACGMQHRSRRRLARWVLAAALASAGLTLGAGPAVAPAAVAAVPATVPAAVPATVTAASPAASTAGFTSLSPARLLDTRSGLGEAAGPVGRAGPSTSW
jgi:hypothetical protein